MGCDDREVVIKRLQIDPFPSFRLDVLGQLDPVARVDDLSGFHCIQKIWDDGMSYGKPYVSCFATPEEFRPSDVLIFPGEFKVDLPVSIAPVP